MQQMQHIHQVFHALRAVTLFYWQTLYAQREKNMAQM